MRYLKRLFAYLGRRWARPEQLEFPFHVKASRRATLLRPRGRGLWPLSMLYHRLHPLSPLAFPLSTLEDHFFLSR